MDDRPPLSAPRPQAPKRAVSGSALYLHKFQGRPTLPSRLSTVRSVSQPANVVDLTADAAEGCGKNTAAFLNNQANLSLSPDVIEVEGEDDDGAPPSKKAKTTGTGFRAEGIAAVEAQDEAHRTTSGSPLPAPPKAGLSKAIKVRSGGERLARQANGTEPPAMATRLPPPKNVADFSPWTGNHAEDVMNETAVKVGYSDKGVGANQTESNSARPAIWPNLSLKNNMGLQTLSYLFTQVMEKRQTMGRCTAPSTFKPPPRVTVTDTKREAWLRDLANPAVPLRKQSRTIPHGIRGKLLMDQCLAKNIPLQRAVWLAKCVGANELRAFRRKGISGASAASGESKWVREWTLNVEQFLDGVINACGQPEWKEKMNYAAKLAAAFYAEKLMDADHYLDWIVTSFAGASLEHLPIWIIMLQICWRDTTSLIRRGRVLAEGVLAHLHRLMQGVHDDNTLLKSRLQKLLAVLAVTHRGCLVIPQTWDKYKYLLTPTPSPEPALGESAARSIAKRNERLARSLRAAPADTRCKLLDLYNELDSVPLDLDVNDLTMKISTIIPDLPELVNALLDWASSPYRQGLARTYLVARLIIVLRSMGHDTDSAVLQGLPSAAKHTAAQAEGIHKVIAELVRVESFSVGRYMQWLITSGALSDPDESTRAAGLLASLPYYSLPQHLQNTRHSLLRRLGVIVDQRSLAVGVSAKPWQTDAEPSSLESMLSMSQCKSLDLSEKTIIGERIRSAMSMHYIESTMTVSQFCNFRATLEWIEDVPSLIELVKGSLDTDDAVLLATVVDTINMHAESLAALGQLISLFNHATEQYRHLRSQQPLDRTLILALTGLASRLSNDSSLLDLLTNDLVICEQQISLVVCSPASDSLIGMHASSLDSDHDIDAVFASGNVMDEMLLQRVFERVMQRAVTVCGPVDYSMSKLSTWFNQLRTLGSSGFDQLSHDYIRAVFHSSSDGVAKTGAITALVGSGCVGLDEVFSAAQEASTSQAALCALRLLIEPSAGNPDMSAAEQYRYRLMQITFCSEHLPILAELLCRAAESDAFDPENSAMGDLLISLTSRSPGKIKEKFESYCRTPASLINAAKIARALIRRGVPAAFAQRQLDPTTMINLAGPLSVRYCACALEYTVREQVGKGAEADNTMLELMIGAITSGNPVWPVLQDALDTQTKRALHDWAQNQLLYATTRLRHSVEAEVRDVTRRYLDVLDITYPVVKDDEDHAIIAILAERLKDYSGHFDGENGTAVDHDEAWSRSLTLDALLHLCVLHVQTPVADTEVARQSRGNLLLALCSLLDHPKLQVQGDLRDYIFDLASTLADRLPVHLIARSGGAARPNSSQVQSILGAVNESSESWLALASQVQPAGSQQQRALSKHSSQQLPQPHAGGRPGPPSQGSTSSPQHAQQAHQQPQKGWPRTAQETKMTPFPLRTWEIMPDPTPVMGENDTSLSLRLFGARKV